MNKAQAKTEYIKIIQNRNAKAEEIKAKAQKNGTWKKGLDSNNELFKEIDNEAKKKIESLKMLIDEE